MFQEIQFPRDIDNVLASTNDAGLLVIAGWIMGIPKATAIEYVKTYNTSPSAGFFEQNGEAILSHGPGKLTLTQTEAAAVVELVKEAYGPI
jgi:hypothetical protein